MILLLYGTTVAAHDAALESVPAAPQPIDHSAPLKSIKLKDGVAKLEEVLSQSWQDSVVRPRRCQPQSVVKS